MGVVINMMWEIGREYVEAHDQNKHQYILKQSKYRQ